MTEAQQTEPDLAERGADVLPATESVTGHTVDENELSPTAKRKREQRERDKAAGVEVFGLKLGLAEQAMLAEGQQFRASRGKPYTATEYLLTLVRRDNELIQQQREVVANKICAHCRKPMPRGCGGVWAGDLPCALPQLERALWL
jgi:hypothetical protein